MISTLMIFALSATLRYTDMNFSHFLPSSSPSMEASSQDVLLAKKKGKNKKQKNKKGKKGKKGKNKKTTSDKKKEQNAREAYQQCLKEQVASQTARRVVGDRYLDCLHNIPTGIDLDAREAARISCRSTYEAELANIPLVECTRPRSR